MNWIFLFLLLWLDLWTILEKDSEDLNIAANSGATSISSLFFMIIFLSFSLTAFITNSLKSKGIIEFTIDFYMLCLLKFQSQVLSGTLSFHLYWGRYSSIRILLLANLRISFTLSLGRWWTWITFSKVFLIYYHHYQRRFTFIFPEIRSETYLWFAWGSGGRYTSPSSRNILYISFMLDAFSEMLLMLIFDASIFFQLMIIVSISLLMHHAWYCFFVRYIAQLISDFAQNLITYMSKYFECLIENIKSRFSYKCSQYLNYYIKIFKYAKFL